jgi:excisionase family DNA binding protein
VKQYQGMDGLLSVKQVAFILKVHPLSVRRYIKQGRLKAVKVGGNVRVRDKDLQEFHKELSVASPQQSIILNAKRSMVARIFTQEDPFLRLSGRGASLELSEK